MIYNAPTNNQHHSFKMVNAKTYLNVPFAEKDAAKALGAKWDATHKKWYAPANADITLFTKWQSQSASSNTSTTSKAKPRSTTHNAAQGVTTHPKDKTLVTYSGDEPPWD